MDHFDYRGGQLAAEAVPLARIAEEVGTPFYCYSTATIERHYQAFTEAFGDRPITVCYAVKANGNLAVIRTLARLGAGADVVSVGEMRRALAAGVPPSKIVFSGVGKSDSEIAAALDVGIRQINVESEIELEAVSRVAAAAGKRARVSLRVNPDVDAKTHAKIATGKSETKFGIDWTQARAVYAKAANLPGIAVKGVDVHIGSQLLDLAPFREAFARVRELVLALRGDGLAIESIDLGGGLGIPYRTDGAPAPTPAEYADIVLAAVGDLNCDLVFEPGRMIVGNAGILVTRVLYVKVGVGKHFAIVDAAMNDLLRPALYDAYHEIIPVVERSPDAPLMTMDVVGPICETGDILGEARALPALQSGDLLAIRTAGAYGAVMASTYNARPLIPEVLVKGADYSVVRRRIDVEEMLAWESVPNWLDGSD
jgi:diaminopimelate decarboxylase